MTTYDKMKTYKYEMESDDECEQFLEQHEDEEEGEGEREGEEEGEGEEKEGEGEDEDGEGEQEEENSLKIYLNANDMAYVMGRGGETIDRIRRCSGIAYEAHGDGITLFGTDEEIACGRLGIRLMLELLREGRLSIDLQALEVQEKFVSVDIPNDSVGFVIGKDGVTFRRIESRHSVLMFLDQMPQKVGAGYGRLVKSLYIMGTAGNRESALEAVAKLLRTKATMDQGPPRRLHDFGRTGDLEKRDRPYECNRRDRRDIRYECNRRDRKDRPSSSYRRDRDRGYDFDDPRSHAGWEEDTRDYMEPPRGSMTRDYERNGFYGYDRDHPYHDPRAPWGPRRPRGPPPMQGPYDEAPMWGRAHGVYDFDDPRSHHLDRPYVSPPRMRRDDFDDPHERRLDRPYAEPPRMRRDYYDDRERY